MSKQTGSILVVSLMLGLIGQDILGRKLVNFKVAQSHSYEFKGHPYNPIVYQVLSFGYLPAIVDWRWLKVLMDAPVFQKKLEVKSQLYFDLNLLADLDADFRDVYVHGAHLVSLLYFDPEGAITLLKRGISAQEILDLQKQSRILADQWGNQWEIPLLLGYFYFFEMDSLGQAAEYIQRAGMVKDSPHFVKSLSQKLSKPLGKYEVGLSVLNLLLSSAKTAKLEEKYSVKKSHLEKAYFMAKVNLEFSQFRAGKPMSVENAWNVYPAKREDPWGGRLFIDGSGRIRTSTPYEPVLGIE